MLSSNRAVGCRPAARVRLTTATRERNGPPTSWSGRFPCFRPFDAGLRPDRLVAIESRRRKAGRRRRGIRRADRTSRSRPRDRSRPGSTAPTCERWLRETTSRTRTTRDTERGPPDARGEPGRPASSADVVAVISHLPQRRGRAARRRRARSLDQMPGVPADWRGTLPVARYAPVSTAVGQTQHVDASVSRYGRAPSW